jgi:hypothetical protein
MTKPGQTKTHTQRQADYVARQKAKDSVGYKQKEEIRAKKNREKMKQQLAMNPATAAVQTAAMLLANQEKEVGLVVKESYKAGAKNRKLVATYTRKMIGVAPTPAPFAKPAAAYKQDEGRDEDDEEGIVTGPNTHWKRGTPIVLPLTWERRVIRFNMDEDWCLTSMALKLTQETFEDNIPAVKPKDVLGGVLTQVQHDLPAELRADLWNIREGRVFMQHNKKKSYRLDERPVKLFRE